MGARMLKRWTKSYDRRPFPNIYYMPANRTRTIRQRSRRQRIQMHQKEVFVCIFVYFGGVFSPIS